MIPSRRRRLEERRQTKRLVFAVVGMMGFLLFLAVFGLKLLTLFSVAVERLRGGSSAQQLPSETVVLPPVLDSFPTATSSGAIPVRGTAADGLTITLYINEAQARKITTAKDGTFFFESVRLMEGDNTISAKATDERGNTSDLSNVLTITMKKTPPSLEISSPQNNERITGDSNVVTISGRTETDTTVTVNSRLVVIKSDGSFAHAYPLNEGENKLTIAAVDIAGNQTIVERTVIYQR